MSNMIQFDHRLRAVSVPNLEAMCERVSGMCHRYTLDGITKTRAYVEYSNPDEWGHEAPMTAVFPVIHGLYGKDCPAVVLSIMNVQKDNQHGEGWQSFGCIVDGPELWRAPGDGVWATREEIEAQKPIFSGRTSRDSI
ncbi:hypothetical protein LCGC14_1395920 [marine sediment metagenome]|uniref:Uncharacterized protein n=1 Tax=marine sediment metagenome TaxID=412755 RepID=A0A0F9JYL8_9ZZZZ